jgi:hypothetical protein
MILQVEQMVVAKVEGMRKEEKDVEKISFF